MSQKSQSLATSLSGVPGRYSADLGTPNAADAELIRIESNYSFCVACLSAMGGLARKLEEWPSHPEFATWKHRTMFHVILFKDVPQFDDLEERGCFLCSLVSARLSLKLHGIAKLPSWREWRILLSLEVDIREGGHLEPRKLIYSVLPQGSGTFEKFFTLELKPSPGFYDFFFAPGALARGSSTRSAREVAADWLARCIRDKDSAHYRCGAELKPWYPTRLLDLCGAANNESIPVVYPEAEPEVFAANPPYITLSYCWGAWGVAGLPSLRCANKTERETSGIRWDELPRLFRDCVEVAGWFKVRWLWIDSLCIIQDSNSDWEHEAGRMCEVYKNGLLNISADDCVDARESLFFDRAPQLVTPFKFSMTNLGRSWWTVQDSAELFEWLYNCPLSDRAWALQERQLARRGLHFTAEEVFWECHANESLFRCETYPAGFPFVPEPGPERELAPWLDRTPWLDRGGLHDATYLLKTWHKLCADFSRRRLSFESDRLPALSGLAKEFSALLPADEYAAGLWTPGLPQSLLWQRELGVPRLPGVDAGYIAPSWSWLSLPFEVGYDDSYDLDHAISDFAALDVTPVGENKFGTVRENAAIELMGLTRWIRVGPRSSELFVEDEPVRKSETGQLEGIQSSFFKLDEETGGSGRRRALSTISRRGESEVSVDGGKKRRTVEKLRESRESRLLFLFIAVSRREYKTRLQIRGLLLEETETENVFCRAGRMNVDEPSAQRMRYRLRGSCGADGEAAEWEQLDRGVMPVWGFFTIKAGNDGGTATEVGDDPDTGGDHVHRMAKPLTKGPLSLYEFDAGIDSSRFERLTPRTVRII